jgi:hypothetical protein
MIFGKKKENPELEKITQLLLKGTVDLFEDRGGIKFTSEPIVERKKIIEYEGRMRVDGMEKFDNEPTYISAINYYLNAAAMEKHAAVGALVVYVKQDYLAKLLRMMGYPPIDDESDDELRDSCGTLCNLISGRFKSEMASAGYIELEMSAFINFRNNSFGGVEFCSSEYDKYQLSFDINGVKQMVVEMTMGIIPKR